MIKLREPDLDNFAVTSTQSEELIKQRNEYDKQA